MLPFWVVLFIILASAFREIAQSSNEISYISTTGEISYISTTGLFMGG
jgi:hypothetical protein